MIKPYNELVNLDISKYLSQRDGLDYLNWAKCVQLLHDNGAEKVFFTPLLNSNGSSLFMTDEVYTDKNKVTNRCYEVGVHIVVDDDEFDMRGPLLNGSNPVKDNSMNQQRIWNCQTRLFVKGIAIRYGLGFNLWAKEEEAEAQLPSTMDDPYSHSLLVIKERIEQKITELMDKGLSTGEIAEQTKIGTTNEDVKDVIRGLIKAYNFENLLKTIEVKK